MRANVHLRKGLPTYANVVLYNNRRYAGGFAGKPHCHTNALPHLRAVSIRRRGGYPSFPIAPSAILPPPFYPLYLSSIPSLGKRKRSKA